MSNRVKAPRIVRGYTKKELDLLMTPDSYIGFHYYKSWIGDDVIEKEIYCNNCHLYEKNKCQWNYKRF
jgi:hypothetical protein